MTKSNIKKAIKVWMKKYSVSLEDSVKVLMKNHPEHSVKIAQVHMDLMVKDVLNVSGI